MSMQTNLEALIEAAQHLTREEQQKLLDALSARPLEPPHRITEMRGLGKDIWRGSWVPTESPRPETASRDR